MRYLTFLIFTVISIPLCGRSEPQRVEEDFFNGTDLSGWKGNEGFWTVKEGAIVGHSDSKISKNEFLWSPVKVKDFHLSLEVKLEPNTCNAGIQFRSRPINDYGQARGYQADVGQNVWGRLYHEHGRKKLDWRGAGEAAVKPGEWNHYEILAVGDRIWTAINGKLSVAIQDPKADLEGQIAVQIHSGPPQTVQYRNLKLTHNPAVSLAGMSEEDLNAALIPPEDIKNSAAIIPRSVSPGLEERRSLPHFKNGFQTGKNPVIVLTGGTDVVKQSRNGYLETLLTRLSGNKPVLVRNLGWQADTVYAQQRPREFGTHFDTLNRIDASIVIATFGQMESLDGVQKIPDFLAAYRTLLDEYERKTKQIVLVTPHRFEKPESDLLPDLTAHNESVEKYSEAIRELAKERNYICVDLKNFEVAGQTLDGIHFTDQGHWKLAFETVSQLTGAAPLSGDAVNESGAFSDPQLEALRQAIVKKNFLWHQHWRPTNWAFAYGDRQKVPSSHDHRPGKPRWMPKEIDQIIGLIENAEGDIQTLNNQIK
ncbi:MAG: DUF1080 domain-containing protein [Verrucomicrobiales bacterium]|nr:DUF1080 domain-containing protein [Verrucomicrobiales bacterium]